MNLTATRFINNMSYRFPNVDINVIEDAVSDGFLKCLENKNSVINPVGYITIVAINAIKSHLRELQKTAPLNFDISNRHTGQLDLLIRNEESKLMKEALKLLPIKQKRFIIQYYNKLHERGHLRNDSDYTRVTRIRKKLRVSLKKMLADCP